MALVEFACVLPLIAILAFGIIEFGMAWQDKLRVQTAVRAGARVGSNAGKLSTADQHILLGVGAPLADIGLSNVNWVVVFKSTTTDGVVPSACITPTPHSVSGSCNAYSGAQLEQVVGGTSPSSWFGCGVGLARPLLVPDLPPEHPGAGRRLSRHLGQRPAPAGDEVLRNGLDHGRRTASCGSNHRRPE